LTLSIAILFHRDITEAVPSQYNHSNETIFGLVEKLARLLLLRKLRFVFDYISGSSGFRVNRRGGAQDASFD
jgi:hypothetical protein